ncbi:MAG: adenylosuccinate synthase [Bacteroidales bacterium]|nr:adenylosuccinate synthase [Bacteroidales bacterium]MCF8403660.1 adenylosuccinate synthase [Bacteroidales bacterium]
MKADILLGLQWGDEGKGKLVDVLTPNYDIIARFQGGPNAGHTIEFDGKKFVLHTIPSGIFNPKTINVVGNGVIIDPYIFCKELKNLRDSNIKVEENLLVAKKAHLILPTHRLLDAAYEMAKGKEKIGSTLKGIGPTYTDKTARLGLRVGNILRKDFLVKYNELKERHIKILKSYQFDYLKHELDGLNLSAYEEKWFSAVEEIKTLKIIDCEYYINACINSGKRVLAEGAQGTMLDIDFGTYPFVTSSNTVAAGVCTGLGIAPHKVGEVYGIFKAYCTRVGSGPFPSEDVGEDGQKLRDDGNEYGSTTGRPRRCGWLDLVALKYAIMLDGVTQLLMTKADVLNSFASIKVATGYTLKGKKLDYFPFEGSYDKLEAEYELLEGWHTDISKVVNFGDMPEKLLDYTRYIERQTGVPVKIISVGPDRKQVIHL